MHEALEAAVERLLQDGQAADFLLELGRLRDENEQLREALRVTQAVDDAELDKLWATIEGLEVKLALVQREEGERQWAAAVAAAQQHAQPPQLVGPLEELGEEMAALFRQLGAVTARLHALEAGGGGLGPASPAQQQPPGQGDYGSSAGPCLPWVAQAAQRRGQDAALLADGAMLQDVIDSSIRSQVQEVLLPELRAEIRATLGMGAASSLLLPQGLEKEQQEGGGIGLPPQVAQPAMQLPAEGRAVEEAARTAVGQLSPSQSGQQVSPAAEDPVQPLADRFAAAPRDVGQSEPQAAKGDGPSAARVLPTQRAEQQEHSRSTAGHAQQRPASQAAAQQAVRESEKGPGSKPAKGEESRGGRQEGEAERADQPGRPGSCHDHQHSPSAVETGVVSGSRRGDAQELPPRGPSPAKAASREERQRSEQRQQQATSSREQHSSGSRQERGEAVAEQQDKGRWEGQWEGAREAPRPASVAASTGAAPLPPGKLVFSLKPPVVKRPGLAAFEVQPVAAQEGPNLPSNADVAGERSKRPRVQQQGKEGGVGGVAANAASQLPKEWQQREDGRTALAEAQGMRGAGTALPGQRGQDAAVLPAAERDGDSLAAASQHPNGSKDLAKTAPEKAATPAKVAAPVAFPPARKPLAVATESAVTAAAAGAQQAAIPPPWKALPVAAAIGRSTPAASAAATQPVAAPTRLGKAPAESVKPSDKGSGVGATHGARPFQPATAALQPQAVSAAVAPPLVPSKAKPTAGAVGAPISKSAAGAMQPGSTVVPAAAQGTAPKVARCAKATPQHAATSEAQQAGDPVSQHAAPAAAAARSVSAAASTAAEGSTVGGAGSGGTGQQGLGVQHPHIRSPNFMLGAVEKTMSASQLAGLPLICPPCSAKLPSLEAYHSHMLSEQHLKRVEAVMLALFRGTTKPKKHPAESVRRAASSWFHCHSCERTLDCRGFLTHLVSKPHLQRVGFLVDNATMDAGSAAVLAPPHLDASTAELQSFASRCRAQEQPPLQIDYSDPNLMPGWLPSDSAPAKPMALQLRCLCPPCNLKLGSPNEYLEHLLTPVHLHKSMQVFEAFTGPNKSKALHYSKKGRSELLARPFHCWACDRTLKLDEFLQHQLLVPHLAQAAKRLREPGGEQQEGQQQQQQQQQGAGEAQQAELCLRAGAAGRGQVAELSTAAALQAAEGPLPPLDMASINYRDPNLMRGFLQPGASNAAGQEPPRVCPPCGLVLAPPVQFLKHLLSSQHVKRSRQLLEALTGPRKHEALNYSPASRQALRERRYHCLACNQTLQLEGFLRHQWGPLHLNIVAEKARRLLGTASGGPSVQPVAAQAPQALDGGNKHAQQQQQAQQREQQPAEVASLPVVTALAGTGPVEQDRHNPGSIAASEAAAGQRGNKDGEAEALGGARPESQAQAAKAVGPPPGAATSSAGPSGSGDCASVPKGAASYASAAPKAAAAVGQAPTSEAGDREPCGKPPALPPPQAAASLSRAATPVTAKAAAAASASYATRSASPGKLQAPTLVAPAAGIKQGRTPPAGGRKRSADAELEWPAKQQAVAWAGVARSAESARERERSPQQQRRQPIVFVPQPGAAGDVEPAAGQEAAGNAVELRAQRASTAQPWPAVAWQLHNSPLPQPQPMFSVLAAFAAAQQQQQQGGLFLGQAPGPFPWAHSGAAISGPSVGPGPMLPIATAAGMAAGPGLMGGGMQLQGKYPEAQPWQGQAMVRDPQVGQGQAGQLQQQQQQQQQPTFGGPLGDQQQELQGQMAWDPSGQPGQNLWPWRPN